MWAGEEGQFPTETSLGPPGACGMWFIKGAIGLVADTGRRRECWPREEQKGEVGGGGNALHVLEGGNDCVSWNAQKHACDLSSTSGHVPSSPSGGAFTRGGGLKFLGRKVTHNETRGGWPGMVKSGHFNYCLPWEERTGAGSRGSWRNGGDMIKINWTKFSKNQ